MPTPDITVIIPVYNAEAYVAKAVSSVLDQSIGLDRLEVILVDDGSTDGSGEVLDRLAAAHPEVCVTRQANSGGPSSPRNAGLSRATGRYVQFLDADDHLAPEALERMLGMADTYDSDVVLGRVEGTGGRATPRTMFTHNQPRADLYSSRVYWSLSVAKLFRRELIERLGLRFDEDLLFGEDQPFSASMYLNAAVISVLADYTCYFWHRRSDGQNNSTVKRGLERMLVPEVMLRLLADNVGPGPKRDYLMRRHFECDVPIALEGMLAEVSRRRQEDARERLATLLDTWCTDEMADQMSAYHRICFDLARRGMLGELLDVVRSVVLRDRLTALAEGGRVYLRYPFFRDPDVGVPDSCYDESARVHVARHLDVVTWEKSVLRIEGTAHLGFLAPTALEIALVLRERRSGDEHIVEARQDTGGPPGFLAYIDPRTAASGEPLSPGLWDVSALVSTQGVTRRGRLGAQRADAVDTRPRPRVIVMPDGRAEVVTSYYTDSFGNLTLDVGDVWGRVEEPFVVDRVDWGAQDPPSLVIEGRTHVANIPEQALAVVATDADGVSHRVACELGLGDAGDEFIAQLEPGRAAEGHALPAGTYALDVELDLGDLSGSKPVPEPVGLRTIRWWKGIVPHHARPSRNGSVPMTLTIVPVHLGRALGRRLDRAGGASVRRYLLLALGWLFLGLGALGMVLPVLPTTPFVLLAAACFLRSSERLHAWLIAHPTFGAQITDYLDGKGLRRKTKAVAIATLWASIIFSAVFFVPLLAADIVMVLVAAGVTVYLLRLPTAP